MQARSCQGTCGTPCAGASSQTQSCSVGVSAHHNRIVITGGRHAVLPWGVVDVELVQQHVWERHADEQPVMPRQLRAGLRHAGSVDAQLLAGFAAPL